MSFPQISALSVKRYKVTQNNDAQEPLLPPVQTDIHGSIQIILHSCIRSTNLTSLSKIRSGMFSNSKRQSCSYGNLNQNQSNFFSSSKQDIIEWKKNHLIILLILHLEWGNIRDESNIHLYSGLMYDIVLNPWHLLHKMKYLSFIFWHAATLLVLFEVFISM